MQETTFEGRLDLCSLAWPAGDDTGNDLLFVRDSAVPWSHGEDGWDRA